MNHVALDPHIYRAVPITS
jgi:hypothetical protein